MRMRSYARRIAIDAFLTAIALALSIAESFIPPFIPVPGVKIGIANIVTVYAILEVGKTDAVQILLTRIFLSFIFAGQTVSLLFSLTGGVMCLILMCIMTRVISKDQIWVLSIIGALAHNIGQIAVAVILAGNKTVLLYLPVLIISGIITGAATGILAQIFISRTHGKIYKNAR